MDPKEKVSRLRGSVEEKVFCGEKSSEHDSGAGRAREGTINAWRNFNVGLIPIYQLDARKLWKKFNVGSFYPRIMTKVMLGGGGPNVRNSWYSPDPRVKLHQFAGQCPGTWDRS